MIADLAKIDNVVKIQAQQSIYQNTFIRAQEYNLQMEKTVGPDYLPWSYYGHHWPFFPPGWHRPPPYRTDGFLDEYVST